MPVPPGSRFVCLLAALVLGAGTAHAQVSDPATCSKILPICTPTRPNCCTRDFTSAASAKAILIPTDRCHQQVANTGADGPPGGSTGDSNAPNWCADPPGTDVNSMFFVYGLVYRLMQRGIPVYWLVNSTKAPTTIVGFGSGGAEATTDVDFWVLAPSTNPPAPTAPLTSNAGTAIMQLLTTNVSLQLVAGTNYSKKEFPVRGGAFLIASEDRAAFDTFWAARRGGADCGTSGLDCYDFRSVRVYQIDPSAHFSWQDYSQALVAGEYVRHDNQLPVAMRVDYPPPKVARVTQGAAMTNWLSIANMNDAATNTATCKTGTAFVPSDAIACDLTQTDINSNDLVSGGFNWLWFNIDSSGGGCSTTSAKLISFLTAVPGSFTPGNVMFSDSGIKGAEACAGSQILGSIPNGGLQLLNGVNETAAAPFILRFPGNLFVQYGDLAIDFASGTVGSWRRVVAGLNRYSSTFDTAPVTLRRLITQEQSTNTNCANHDDLGIVGGTSTAGCDDASVTNTADIVDMFAYGRYLNNRSNGMALYSPGQNLNQNSQRAQLKMVLSSMIASPAFTVEQVVNNIEVTRSTPIVASVSNQAAVVQGSFDFRFVTKAGILYPQPRNPQTVEVPDDLLAFSFPSQTGHLRATAASSIGTTASTLDTGTVLFDAANGIPTASFTGCTPSFGGTCRTVFTTTAGGRLPPNVFVSESNVATLGPVMLPGFTTPQQNLFIDRVLQGFDTGSGYVSKLGGIDRSTVAVIGPGTSVGANRPTIAYVGATDGMLHAICASITGPCTALGKELWAYIPRTNLPYLRFNAARVDGSPHVIDVKADFFGTGKVIRSVLLFQTGSGDATSAGVTPAVYALDVSDPTTPRVLWDYTLANPATRGAFELGAGLAVAAGEVTIAGVTKTLAFVQTNNGGTGGAGSVVTAINIEDGSVVWQTGFAYPNPPRVPANLPVPATGMPGGVVTVDKSGSGANGFMTDIVYADLFGNLWEVDPATGASRYQSGVGADVPLFSFETDFHPIGALPALFDSGGQQFAVFGSGGYADVSGTTSWGTYAPVADPQRIIAVALNTPNSGVPTVPLTENSSATFVPVNIPFGAGEASFSQVQVVGSEFFVTTDSAVVNGLGYGTSSGDTGKVYRYNYATGTAGATQTTAYGASSVANDGTNLYSSSGGKHQRLTSGAASTTGPAVTAADAVNKMVRKLWLRTE